MSPPSPDLGLPDPDTDARYTRVRDALAHTGAALAPRPGWEDRVWAQVDAEAAPRVRERGPRWALTGGLVLAAAAALLLVWRPWRGGPGAPATPGETAPVVASIDRVRGDAVVRADSWTVGDRLRVDFPAADAAVWVYRGEDRLLVACSARALRAPACQPSGAGVRALIDLPVPGTYHVLTAAFAGDAPATLDLALGALTRAGARFQQQTVEVY